MFGKHRAAKIKKLHVRPRRQRDNGAPLSQLANLLRPAQQNCESGRGSREINRAIARCTCVVPREEPEHRPGHDQTRHTEAYIDLNGSRHLCSSPGKTVLYGESAISAPDYSGAGVVLKDCPDKCQMKARKGDYEAVGQKETSGYTEHIPYRFLIE
jgi:hypothetical protein